MKNKATKKGTKVKKELPRRPLRRSERLNNVKDESCTSLDPIGDQIVKNQNDGGNFLNNSEDMKSHTDLTGKIEDNCHLRDQMKLNSTSNINVVNSKMTSSKNLHYSRVHQLFANAFEGLREFLRSPDKEKLKTNITRKLKTNNIKDDDLDNIKRQLISTELNSYSINSDHTESFRHGKDNYIERKENPRKISSQNIGQNKIPESSIFRDIHENSNCEYINNNIQNHNNINNNNINGQCSSIELKRYNNNEIYRYHNENRIIPISDKPSDQLCTQQNLLYNLNVGNLRRNKSGIITDENNNVINEKAIVRCNTCRKPKEIQYFGSKISGTINKFCFKCSENKTIYYRSKKKEDKIKKEQVEKRKSQPISTLNDHREYKRLKCLEDNNNIYMQRNNHFQHEISTTHHEIKVHDDRTVQADEIIDQPKQHNMVDANMYNNIMSYKYQSYNFDNNNTCNEQLPNDNTENTNRLYSLPGHGNSSPIMNSDTDTNSKMNFYINSTNNKNDYCQINHTKSNNTYNIYDNSHNVISSTNSLSQGDIKIPTSNQKINFVFGNINYNLYNTNDSRHNNCDGNKLIIQDDDGNNLSINCSKDDIAISHTKTYINVSLLPEIVNQLKSGNDHQNPFKTTDSIGTPSISQTHSTSNIFSNSNLQTDILHHSSSSIIESENVSSDQIDKDVKQNIYNSNGDNDMNNEFNCINDQIYNNFNDSTTVRDFRNNNFNFDYDNISYVNSDSDNNIHGEFYFNGGNIINDDNEDLERTLMRNFDDDFNGRKDENKYVEIFSKNNNVNDY